MTIKIIDSPTEEKIQNIEEYLYLSTKKFWNGIKSFIDYKPSISGYTTTLNCIKQQYQYKECIQSLLTFCNEVCVVDGGSTDGTYEELQKLSLEDNRIKLKQKLRDWNHPRFAIFDGLQKAEARAMCTGEFCWQIDSDEIVHEDDAAKIIKLTTSMPKDALVIALPVVEYWGGPDKVRLDITPWKWRLSRNNSNITHGVPGKMRISVNDNEYYAHEGTDGCDMIFNDTLELVPVITFYTQEVDNVRKLALLGNENARLQYENWFNAVVSNLPGVHHYSWYNLSRKIKLYRDYWTNHWSSLYGKSLIDSAETNMMFDKPWSEVTDEMINELAIKLKTTGGHIWHSKWDGKITPWININRNEPKIMLSSYMNV